MWSSRGVTGRRRTVAVRMNGGCATGVYTGLARVAITSPWQIQPQSSAFCPLNGHGDMIALEGQRQSTEDGRTRRLKTLGHGDYGARPTRHPFDTPCGAVCFRTARFGTQTLKQAAARWLANTCLPACLSVLVVGPGWPGHTTPLWI